MSIKHLNVSFVPVCLISFTVHYDFVMRKVSKLQIMFKLVCRPSKCSHGPSVGDQYFKKPTQIEYRIKIEYSVKGSVCEVLELLLGVLRSFSFRTVLNYQHYILITKAKFRRANRGTCPGNHSLRDAKLPNKWIY